MYTTVKMTLVLKILLLPQMISVLMFTQHTLLRVGLLKETWISTKFNK